MGPNGAIRVVVTGATGRMGSAIVRAVRDQESMRLVGATEKPGSAAIGLDAGLAAHLGPLEVTVDDELAKAIERGRPQVVIDFTSAEASERHATVCAASGVALVVGSTGFTAHARQTVVQAAEKVPIVMSPNMSAGVNVLLKLVAQAARVLGERFDVEVLELHHRMKRDAPSGTAMRLAELIAESRGLEIDEVVYARRGEVGERPRRQIGVQTLRGGDAVGEHTVFFIADGERLELTHRASSRDQFAWGAVQAARWVVGKEPRLYDMQDVLGLK